MNHDKQLVSIKPNMELTELAVLGVQDVAYVRQVNSSDIIANFPQIEGLPEDLKLWALFAADGQPLALSDHPHGVLENADDLDLVTVARH